MTATPTTSAASTSTSAANPAASPASGGPARRSRFRPTRGVLIGAGLVVLLALVAILVPRGDGFRPLDPASAGPTGARALSQVLERRGVQTDVVRSVEELRAARTDSGTTVLVTGPDVPERAVALLRERRDVHRLVLVTPSAPILDGLNLPATPVGRQGRLEAACEVGAVQPTDTLSAGSLVYRPTTSGVTTCFAAIDEDRPDDVAPAAYLEFGATGSHPDTVVFGQDQAFSNAHITRESHAAIALRLLGTETTRVLWYVPSPDEDDPAVEGDRPTAPEWILPALIITALTVLLLCLWRGRRLGPITVEPLPVVVPAGETTSARARLYRRAGDEQAVARILTDAATEEIRRRLRLPADADVARIAEAVHRATGEDRSEVSALLSTTVPDSLDAHARRLRRLRRKVRTS
ncbi:DUF4350 domain-containing protein [Mobilicoccus caccae]|uniref:DUF4350 domain-containing protein n=1 Tax=Mobilicoccus caccae TaxID=1859295 RepID=UPI0024E13960|nr:DUF4350 domain-containing protein [Mobilicoccus caccae]